MDLLAGWQFGLGIDFLFIDEWPKLCTRCLSIVILKYHKNMSFLMMYGMNLHLNWRMENYLTYQTAM